MLPGDSRGWVTPHFLKHPSFPSPSVSVGQPQNQTCTNHFVTEAQLGSKETRDTEARSIRARDTGCLHTHGNMEWLELPADPNPQQLHHELGRGLGGAEGGL